MFHDAWQPLAAEVVLGGEQLPIDKCSMEEPDRCQPRWMSKMPAARPGYCCKASASAAFSSNRLHASLRFVNPSNASTAVISIELPGGTGAGWKLVNVTQMAHTNLTDANPMSDPLHISPVVIKPYSSGAFEAPPQSISVATFTKSK